MRSDHPHCLAAAWIPEPNSSVGAAARKELAIRPERHTEDRTRVPREIEKLLAIGRVPYLDRAVLAGARQPGAVRTESHGIDSVAVRVLSHRNAQRGVPEFCGVIRCPGCDPSAVRTDCRCQHEVLMARLACERLDLLSSCRFPKLQ